MNETVALQAVLQANFPEVDWPAGLWPRLAPLVPLRRVPAGRSLFLQGQTSTALYAVVAGEIEVRFTGLDGRISVIENVVPPRLFGLAAFVAGEPSNYEALASTASRVLVFGPAAYALLMDEVPGFARALMAEFARRFNGTLRLLQASRHLSAAERFELALKQLARERGRPGLGDKLDWLEVRATQAELALLANLSRQTVNELLGQAATRGQLQLGRGRWWIRG